tara:strand:- start:1769 stop:2086 length:318 start_codon:yes stop_codon:yes gene_type:complete
VEYPYAQISLNFPKYYEDLSLRKWERVISEENVDDEECKENASSNTFRNGNARYNNDPSVIYNRVIYTPRTGHAVVEHGGLFYLFAGADSDSRTNDMYQFNPETR